MVKIAHASTTERAKLSMKKVREARKKRQQELAELTLEERAELLKKKYEKTLKEKVAIAMWDYEHRQLPIIKKTWFKNLLNERLSETEDPAEIGKIQRCLKNV